MGVTAVFFHAHPDDEALLTGGTMARLAAAGHRVVLVLATVGEAGLTSVTELAGRSLREARWREANRSACILGVARVIDLGYADSGRHGEIEHPNTLTRADVDTAARRLAEVLLEESAQLLTIYDPAGGYGHPDHLQLHRIGVRASELAATPIVLAATVDRQALQRALRIARLFKPRLADLDPARFANAYTDHHLITHRVDVRAYWRQKRAAMAAHETQAQADSGDRTLAWMLRMPIRIFRVALGREWFVEQGRPPSSRKLDDVLDSLSQPHQPT
jgi:LmbE family N-acetylglucosaminyl deacetylase